MQAEARTYLTEEEYLEIERRAEYRSEYFAGEIFAMAGGSRKHSAIIFNLTVVLGSRLRGGSCRGYSSDLRIEISGIGKYTYPDLTVVCGEEIFHDDMNDTLLNPTVIIEVLSPSTEAYDRGKKFEHYRKLESLREYVLVSQDQPRIETFLRQETGEWLYRDVSGIEAVARLASIDCEMPFGNIYDNVEFDPSE